MQPDRQPSTRWIAGLAVLCAALAGWIYLGFVLRFQAASAGRDMLALRIGGYGSDDVLAMVDFLRSHPDAAAIQRGFLTGPALIFPAVLTVLLILLLRWARPGGVFFGRVIPPVVVGAMFLIPLVYGVADYAETVLGMLLFPPAMPPQQTITNAADILPILVRLKFVALAISIILLIRFAALRPRDTVA